MINTISQLTPQQGAGAAAPATPGEHAPVRVVSDNAVQGQSAPAEPVGKESPPVDILAEAVGKLNEHAQGAQRNLEFSVDDDSGRTVVQVIDTQTEEVIRQIPSEEMLVLIRNFSESIGNIFDEVV